MTTVAPPDKRPSLIDAYVHVGSPRFGSAADLIRVIEVHRIERANVVLGPGTPDFAALRAVRNHLQDAVRIFGIPFGNSDTERAELAEFQIRMGVSGFRFMPFEMEGGREVLRLAGERGLWLLAINPYEDAAVARTLLAWLETHEHARVCSPHFLLPRGLDRACQDTGPLKELLRHPRFFAILSRHGGVGSIESFPHTDLKPWVEGVVALMGWEKLMWGSEYPVLYWRGEHVLQAQNWLPQLLQSLPPDCFARFMSDNARRLFFAEPAPKDEAGPVPSWVDEQWQRQGKVPYFNGALPLDMRTHERLMTQFVATLPPTGEASVRDLINARLDASFPRNP